MTKYSTLAQKYVAGFIGLPTDKPFHTPQEAIPLAEHCFDAGWRAKEEHESVETLKLKELVFTYINDLEALDKEMKVNRYKAAKRIYVVRAIIIFTVSSLVAAFAWNYLFWTLIKYLR